jgi:hypothetical protein
VTSAEATGLQQGTIRSTAVDVFAIKIDHIFGKYSCDVITFRIQATVAPQAAREFILSVRYLVFVSEITSPSPSALILDKIQ